MKTLHNTGLEIREKNSGMIVATVYKHNPNNQTEKQALEIAEYIVEACNSLATLRAQNEAQAEVIEKLREALDELEKASWSEELSGRENHLKNLFRLDKAAEQARAILKETEQA